MVLLLTSSTKLHKESGAAQIRCAAERKGEAAIANDCSAPSREPIAASWLSDVTPVVALKVAYDYVAFYKIVGIYLS
ncbi:hypothetical protein PTT_14183 [Pyrenophora teres f. teres 0-1]|uniref:Uncharacterized protein n=1 Tax=Pyrenophora teres f. teres (strain 0-1) TaxID=861557 RepID=E3RXN3_PYRTT|nr:hypothetical protein PTT_14183 [Pyrenophora teres f. teres 0-1]